MGPMTSRSCALRCRHATWAWYAVAHALKGTLAMFGARPASDCALELERMAASGESVGLHAGLEALQREVEQLLSVFADTRTTVS